MVRRRISEAQRWQIIGMHTTGMSLKATGSQMGYHYAVVSRLVRKHTQTNNVKDLPRSGRPRVTSDRDDRALQRLVRRMPFATSSYSNNTGCPIDVCQQERLETVWNQRDISKGVIKRPLLADRHRRSRLTWCLARRGWNLRTWRNIHWSDKSRFLLHVTDGRMRVWRHKNIAYTPRNIQLTVPYGGGSVMVWGCISHDCKLDLVTIQGNLTGDQYIRNVLQPVVVPHFDNHPLATRPVYMGDNTRPYCSRTVTAYLQSEPGFESHRAYLGHFVSWKQHCIGNSSSYHNRTSDV
jgi:hypothetical protein